MAFASLDGWLDGQAGATAAALAIDAGDIDSLVTAGLDVTARLLTDELECIIIVPGAGAFRVAGELPLELLGDPVTPDRATGIGAVYEAVIDQLTHGLPGSNLGGGQVELGQEPTPEEDLPGA